MTNLVHLEKDAERFTYLYDGNTQVPDHMLISLALVDLLDDVTSWTLTPVIQEIWVKTRAPRFRCRITTGWKDDSAFVDG